MACLWLAQTVWVMSSTAGDSQTTACDSVIRSAADLSGVGDRLTDTLELSISCYDPPGSGFSSIINVAFPTDSRSVCDSGPCNMNYNKNMILDSLNILLTN